jgi:hypothetical protein
MGFGRREQGNTQSIVRGQFSALFAGVAEFWQQDRDKMWVRFEKCPECQPPRWPRFFGRSYFTTCQDFPDHSRR